MYDNEYTQELEKVLYRVSKTLLRYYYVTLGIVYICWAIWVSLMLLVMLIVAFTGVPYYVYYSLMIPSWLVMLVLNFKKIPEVIRGTVSLSGRPMELQILARRIRRLSSIFWIAGVIVYIVMIVIIPLINKSYINTSSASGLIVLLATGNLGIFYSLKKYSGMYIKIPVIIVLGMYIAAILLFAINGVSIFIWSYAIGVLVISYLSFALYCLLLSIR